MKLTSESKFLFGIVLATAAVVAIAVVAFSRPPKSLNREELVPVGTHTLGNPQARVFLVEFSDFQCPACAAFAPVIEQLLRNNPDKLWFAYRHYPLPQHTLAKPAARAAEAAGLQDKYWEMHNLLFKNQKDLSPALFTQLAQSLQLDLARFTNDMASSGIQTKIDADVLYGDKLDLNATPTFYLNGVKLELNTPDDLEKTVKEQIINK